MKRGPTRKKLSSAGMRRHNEAMMKAIDAFMHDAVKEVTRIVANKEMLEDVLEQFEKGERTAGELKAWAFKYRMAESIEHESDEALYDYLEVPQIVEQILSLRDDVFIKFQAIYNQHLEELSNVHKKPMPSSSSRTRGN